MPGRGKERAKDDGRGKGQAQPKAPQEQVPGPVPQSRKGGKITGSTPGPVASKASKSGSSVASSSDEAPHTLSRKFRERSQATSSKAAPPQAPARTTDQQTDSHSKRVNQQMANLTMTSSKSSNPRDKSKEEEPDNFMPNKGPVPSGEELKNLVQGFIALSIALDLGRRAIVIACRLDPTKDPYSSSEQHQEKSDPKASMSREPGLKAGSLKKPQKAPDHPQLPLWIKIEQLKPEFEYWEKEVIGIYGESEYRHLYTDLQGNSSPESPEDVLRWFKTKESIENFFEQASQQAANIIYAMKGRPTEAKGPQRSEPLGDIPIDKAQSPFKPWSALWWDWLFGYLTRFPCFPKLSNKRQVHLWLDLMDERFQEFCEAKASISAGVTYVRQSYTSKWKHKRWNADQQKSLWACDNLLDDLESHCNRWFTQITLLNNHESWRNRVKSSSVSKPDVELATKYGVLRYHLELDDDFSAFEKHVHDFADHARAVLLSKRSLVHNAHDGYETKLLEWKKDTRFQDIFPARDRIQTTTPLISSTQQSYGTSGG